MSLVAKLKTGPATIVAAATAVVVAGLWQASGGRAEEPQALQFHE